MNFYLLNSAMMPNEGVYDLKKITVNEAIAYFRRMADNGSGWMELYQSAIGHQSTADALNTIFDLHGSEKIPVNRSAIQMQPGDEALIFKPKGRIEEGKVLNFKELESIGFEFFKLKMIN